MNHRSWSLAFLVATLFAMPLQAAKPGVKAPDFSVKDTLDVTVSRDSLRGKYVVLEWHNQMCPFVQKHYQSGTMQALQKRWTKKGVIWVTVLGEAPGKELTQDLKAIANEMEHAGAVPSHVVVDVDGKLAQTLGAKTTLHMFVIDPEQNLIYNGAIDNKPTTDPADLKGAINYVDKALTASMAKKPIGQPSTQPYGCSLKL